MTSPNVKESPLLFSAPMIRAILAGTKTQTRRIVDTKLPTDADTRKAGADWGFSQAVADGVKMYSLNDYERLPKQPGAYDIIGSVGWVSDRGCKRTYRCPYGAPGDRLWVITIKPIEFGDGRFGVGDDGHLYRIDSAEPVRMRTQPNHHGYEEVRLRFGGTQRAFRLNRLVCEAFYGSPKPGDVARHLNGNRRDNTPGNLDWGTPLQNQRDAAAAGSFSGEKGSAAKLSRVDMETIRASSDAQAVLATRFGVSQSTISKIRSGKRWAALPESPPRNREAWASRITLEIPDVRVERLQSISEEDARAEGVKTGEMLPAMINGERGQVMIFSPIKAYAVLWDSINGKTAPWSSNPWCWCLSFRRLP